MKQRYDPKSVKVGEWGRGGRKLEERWRHKLLHVAVEWGLLHGLRTPF